METAGLVLCCDWCLGLGQVVSESITDPVREPTTRAEHENAVRCSSFPTEARIEITNYTACLQHGTNKGFGFYSQVTPL